MKRFLSFKNWIFEQEGKKEYGCVMLDTNISDWKKNHLSLVDEKDLYFAEDDEYGYNMEPHITVLYGIHLNETNPEDIVEKMKEMKTVKTVIYEISIFESKDKKYDVVKYDVPVTKQLQEYRKMFEKEFPNTQSFSDYHPHITLAYVKKGLGKKYVQNLEKPFDLVFDKAIYSYFDYSEDKDKKETIKLKEIEK
jgi:2'-5' RNA ligase